MKRWWPVGASLIAGVLVIGAVGILTNAGERSAMAQQGDVSELARRAIGGPGGAQSVTLLPGQLASNAPLDLPLPPGANVVGTIVRDLGNGIMTWDVIMDVSSAPADAGGFFDQNLPSRGWRPPSNFGDQGPPQGLFCQSDQGPWVGVLAVPVSGSSSDVRVHIESGDAGLCAGPPPPPQQQP